MKLRTSRGGGSVVHTTVRSNVITHDQTPLQACVCGGREMWEEEEEEGSAYRSPGWCVYIRSVYPPLLLLPRRPASEPITKATLLPPSCSGLLPFTAAAGLLLALQDCFSNFLCTRSLLLLLLTLNGDYFLEYEETPDYAVGLFGSTGKKMSTFRLGNKYPFGRFSLEKIKRSS